MDYTALVDQTGNKQISQHVRTPVALIVLDGWGLAPEGSDNPISVAATPTMDALWARYPHAAFEASGEVVGLPEGQMGNSEIGHMTIGAGRPVDTDLVRINTAIREDTLSDNGALVALCDHVRAHGGVLHLMGLLSPGGVHSHQAHLRALVSVAVSLDVQRIAIHAFLDGRDTPPASAAAYLAELEELCSDHRVCEIASVAGRYYAMDRDKNWDRIEKAEWAIFDGIAQHVCVTQRPSEVVSSLYNNGVFDEHLPPIVFHGTHGAPYALNDGDALFFFNFRPDRARQLAQRAQAYVATRNILFGTMTEYASDITPHVAFPPFRPKHTLASVISAAGLSQVHIAETEKYAHATYFLNGGREEPHPHEEHVLIESRKDVAMHDQAPEMRAKEIADAAVERIERGVDFVFLNFANADMVGHTANRAALETALAAADTALGRVIDAITARGGVCFVTADHGNAECVIDPVSGERHTAHTTNPVPAILTDNGYELQSGGLPDIAPTLLSVMGLPVPNEMTGTIRARRTQD